MRQYERVAMRPRGANMRRAFCVTRQHFGDASSGPTRMFGQHQRRSNLSF